jgi:hypothetical protein
MWKSKFGGMSVSDALRLRELETENRRLKKLLAESMLENKVVRAVTPPNNPAVTGAGSSRTPHHLLEGMMTPSGLHVERSQDYFRLAVGLSLGALG